MIQKKKERGTGGGTGGEEYARGEGRGGEEIQKEEDEEGEDELENKRKKR